jgi:hypothetical protein
MVENRGGGIREGQKFKGSQTVGGQPFFSERVSGGSQFFSQDYFS